jgi:cell wall-associated NlpC family hydrolase
VPKGIALLLLVALSTIAGVSEAAPSKQDVEDAKARLDTLNGELSVLVEEFNLARLRLEDVEERLSQTRADIERAREEAERADAALNRTAAIAFQELPSEMSAIFEASSLADLSARLEFAEHVAQANAEMALEAENARQEARWLADELARTLEERRAVVGTIERKRDSIGSKIAQARSIYEDLNERYQDALAAERAAAEAAASAQAAADEANSAGGTAPAPVPVVNGSVDAVIAAAWSVLGSPYVFGAADPAVGFDCSGLTMWAWAHAGVSLPHSSTLQYTSLPHVDRSDLQPGDLIFSSYGRLGSGVVDHVGLYVGGGQMIAASNPSTGVAYRPIDRDAYVGAARPG